MPDVHRLSYRCTEKEAALHHFSLPVPFRSSPNVLSQSCWSCDGCCCCLLLEQMIAATAVCGMVYAALAGQPLTIIGSTGPVLAFIAVLYKTSIRMVRDFHFFFKTKKVSGAL